MHDFTGFLPEWDDPKLLEEVLKNRKMSNTRHTPGPWTIDRIGPNDDMLFIQAAHPKGFNVSVALVEYGCTEAEDLGDNSANAKLIAAAPELLQAAVTTLSLLPTEGRDWQWSTEQCTAFNALQAAIDKATK